MYVLSVTLWQAESTVFQERLNVWCVVGVWVVIILCSVGQASLGGRLRMIVTGAAPASPTVLGFLRAALGCQVSDAHTHTNKYECLNPHKQTHTRRHTYTNT